MLTGNGFELIISSDIQYEKLCAEIYFDGEFVAIISQEKGIENATIEIDQPKNAAAWSFQYADFIKILKTAYDSIK